MIEGFQHGPGGDNVRTYDQASAIKASTMRVVSSSARSVTRSRSQPDRDCSIRSRRVGGVVFLVCLVVLSSFSRSVWLRIDFKTRRKTRRKASSSSTASVAQCRSLSHLACETAPHRIVVHSNTGRKRRSIDGLFERSWIRSRGRARIVDVDIHEVPSGAAMSTSMRPEVP
jgi:hypothetical protein